MQQLQQIIDAAWERRTEFSPSAGATDVKNAVAETIDKLDSGTIRVAEKINGEWITHQWIKKAVLLSFRLKDNEIMQGGYTHFYDKVDSKFADYAAQDFQQGGYRVVPPAVARRGAFIAKNAVLMPSYVNIGAYVDEGTMVDTWATVGETTQFGILDSFLAVDAEEQSLVDQRCHVLAGDQIVAVPGLVGRCRTNLGEDGSDSVVRRDKQVSIEHDWRSSVDRRATLAERELETNLAGVGIERHSLRPRDKNRVLCAVYRRENW